MKAVFLDSSTIDPGINLTGINQLVDELKCYPTTQTTELLNRVIDSEIIITNKVMIDAATMQQLPRLKLICITATGTNNVDLIAAKKAGIAVTNVSGYSTTSVAQHIFAFLLNLVSNVEFYLKNNQLKPWHKASTFCQIDAPINELAGKTIGIFGYGNLGQAVAKIASAFSMQILVSERPNATEIRTGRVTFQQMLAKSDVISLHCPLNSETQNLVNQASIALMKPGVILINTARGPVVNSADLLSGLNSGQIGHAIIDVLEQEPPAAAHPLQAVNVPNLTLTHHIAWGSLQAQQRLLDGVALNIKAFINNETLNRVDV